MAGPAAFLFVWTMSGSERPCTTASPLDEVVEPARSISRDDRRRRGPCVVGLDVTPGASIETTPMEAKKGRASYLGPRSVGHQDPGAVSTALLFAALDRAAR